MKWRVILLGTVFTASFLPALFGVTSQGAIVAFTLLGVAAGSGAFLLGMTLDNRARKPNNAPTEPKTQL
jgi:hypothetical protein